MPAFNVYLKGDPWPLYWRGRQLVNCRTRRVKWPTYAGARGVKAWEVRVQCSRGERTLRAGMQWRDGLHGSTWAVVEPEGGRIYSPSGLSGTPTFWCLPVGVLPEAAKHLLDGRRADGCVSFCGDSIAAGLIEPDGVAPSRHQPPVQKDADDATALPQHPEKL
jgi:hypothetical protein